MAVTWNECLQNAERCEGKARASAEDIDRRMLEGAANIWRRLAKSPYTPEIRPRRLPLRRPAGPHLDGSSQDNMRERPMYADSKTLSEAMEAADEAVGIYNERDELVAFNRHYREWRSAIGGEIRVGVPWRELVQESVRTGEIPEARGIEGHWLERREKMRGAYSVVRKLPTGRAFKVSERRMASGGVVAIWTDVTDFIDARVDRVKESVSDERRLVALGGLVSEVAHDFNNSLAVTVGSLELLSKRATFSEEGTRFLQGAILGAKQGMAVAQRLLATARKERLPLPKVADIGAVVENLADVLRDILGESIELGLNAPIETFYSAVDPLELETALVNLVINAHDAITGTGRVVVSLKREATHQDRPSERREYVILTVSDTGSGMGESVLARAADPLFTTKEAGKGTGLGLSAVKHFVESASGRLVLHSSLGVGTAVELWLPALRPL